MAQSQLSITLTGQDKLSPVLKDAQKALTELGEKGSRLDDLQARFNKITNSTAPLKKQLRDIQKLMADMNYEGLDATPLFTQMAEHAGSLADAMGDARTAVNAFANDNFKLEAMAQGMSLVASAGSIATGVMGIFGAENEKVTQAILKVQSALAILNGVQQVANVLNKDSAFMLRLKQIRMAANTKVTLADTGATAANSVAQGVNTATTKLATAARNKLNYAMAVGKALMGDWTGLVLVGAAALTTYALASDDSAEKLDKQEKATEKAKTAIQNYHDKVGGEIGGVISKFKSLQAQYTALKTEAQKTQFIQDNQQAFKQLGIAIKDVTDAQKAFVENSDKVVDALVKQAQANAMASSIEDTWKEFYNDKRNTHHITSGITNRNQLKDERDQKYADTYLKGYLTDKQYKEYQKTGNVPEGMQYGVMKAVNDGRDADKALAQSKITDDTKALAQQAANLQSAADAEFKAAGVLQSSDNKKGGKSGGSKSDKTKTDLDLYRELEQKAKNLESRYKVGLVSKEKADEELKAINDEIKAKFGENAKPVTIDFGIKTDLQIYSDFDKLVKDIQSRFNLNLISEQDAKEQIEAINKLAREKLGENVKPFKLDIKPVVEPGSLNAVKKEISELQTKLANMDISLNPSLYAEYMSKLQELIKKADDLDESLSTDSKASIKAIDYSKFTPGSNEDKLQSYQNTMSNINHLGDLVGAGILDVKDAQEQADKFVEELQSKFPDLELKVKVKKDGTVEEIKNESVSLSDALGMAGQAMQGLGQAISSIDPENEGLQKGALIAQAIGQLALGFAQAMASPASTAAGIFGWIAGGISGVATLATMISQLQSFSTGGVVAGGNYTGDHVLARLNSGEGVLTRRGMHNLNAVMDQAEGGTAVVSGNVQFDIDGTKLRGVLRNTDRKISKQS